MWLVQFANIEIFYKSFIKVLDITIIKVYYDINNKRNSTTPKQVQTRNEPSAGADLGKQGKRSNQEKENKAMTNAQIIFNESVNLMKAGTLKGTGEFVTVELEDGTKEQLEIPEAIHTFARWKAYGRQVKKGEHAKATFYIWKQGKPSKKAKEEAEKNGTEAKARMFQKKAFFFTIDQTEAITATAGKKQGGRTDEV